MTLSVTLRGLVHGSGSDDLRVLRPSNLWEAPDLRTDDIESPGSHGGVAGVDLHGLRRLPVIVQLHAATWADALARMPDVIAAWAPGSEDVELAWSDNTGDYVLVGRPRQARPIMSNAAAGIIRFECRFAATNPFILSAVEYVNGTIAPQASVGRTYPRVYPWHYGPPGAGGLMQITNAGTAPATWKAAIGGPCSQPRLTGPDGSAVAYGGDLAAGEVLELDSRARTVLLQGTASRFGLLDQFDWWTLPPGTSEVQFSTSDGQGGVFFAHRDTWW